MQNAAARLVTNTRKYAHITPVLKSLHWLPVEQRLMYKILLITFRALKFSSPQYINSLIEIYKPSRSGLRSSAEFSLAIPKSKRTWGDRAFASAAPHLWNSLPKSIHLSESVDIFQEQTENTSHGRNIFRVKEHLFRTFNLVSALSILWMEMSARYKYLHYYYIDGRGSNSYLIPDQSSRQAIIAWTSLDSTNHYSNPQKYCLILEARLIFF